MSKATIGVFFGGRSPEHDVSIITGQLIISELKKLNYEVVPIYLSKSGAWHLGEELGVLKFFHNLDENKEELKKYSQYYLDLEDSNGKIKFRSKGIFKKKIEIDLAFPAFHGPNGEDGTIQGVWEIFNIPYVGCGVASSAISMDKIFNKLFYQAYGIPTTDFVHFTSHEWKENKKKILQECQENLAWPVFVKPAQLGSSIGMTCVKEKSELENAIEVAAHYDNKILVEVAVNSLADITCAVLGNEKPQASLLQESVFESDHFSYEDKYLKDGGAQLGNAEDNLKIPARLDSDTTKRIQEMSKDIYTKLGCAGTARIDFLYNRESRQVFANEINPLPGTLYHHLWKKSGVEIGEVCEQLIQFAIQKHKEKNNINYDFRSEILNNANSIKLQLDKKE